MSESYNGLAALFNGNQGIDQLSLSIQEAPSGNCCTFPITELRNPAENKNQNATGILTDGSKTKTPFLLCTDTLAEVG